LQAADGTFWRTTGEVTMGLFDRKKPDIGDPIYTDMRIAEEQLPAEVVEHLEKQMWFMGYPDKLSEWAVTTLGIDNDPKVQMMPQEGQTSDVKRGKTVRPILIPRDLLNALATNEDPHNLVLEFKEWEKTVCNVTGQYCFHFLAEIMEKEGVTERDFPALIVPDYSGASGAPGHDFYWYVPFYPKPINNLDYFIYGRAPMLGKPTLGGYDLAVFETLELFNSGKAVPGLIKAVIRDDQIHVRYYLPLEVVDATGWWTEEEEGIPSSLPR
jgi:hypothetical protein